MRIYTALPTALVCLTLVTSSCSTAPTHPASFAGSSAFAAVGSLAMVQTSLGLFLLARTAQDAFSALTSVCTHEACAINGGAAGNQFVCPCHGSRFSTSGAVVNGPASRPLQQYPTQFANSVLTFTV